MKTTAEPQTHPDLSDATAAEAMFTVFYRTGRSGSRWARVGTARTRREAMALIDRGGDYHIQEHQGQSGAGSGDHANGEARPLA